MVPRTPAAVRVNVAAVSCVYGKSSMVPRTPLALRLNTAATSYLKEDRTRRGGTHTGAEDQVGQNYS